jgi:hypothetical protein
MTADTRHVELLAATFLKVRQAGFRLVGRSDGWFLACDALPAGEFAAGPFGCKAGAAAADCLTALAAVDALTEAGFIIVPLTTPPSDHVGNIYSEPRDAAIWAQGYRAGCAAYMRLTTPPGEWVAWFGGECPVPDGTPFEYILRCGRGGAPLTTSRAWRWNHAGDENDIIAYRLTTPVPGTDP